MPDPRVIATFAAVLMAAGALPASVAAQQRDVECVLAWGMGTPRPIHLEPGQTGDLLATVHVETNATGDTPGEGGLAPYEWRLAPSTLGSVSPDGGAVRFQPSEVPGSTLPMAYDALLEARFTAGTRPGAEVVRLTVLSTATDGGPASCRGTETLVPITVGGGWSLSAEDLSGGDMTIHGVLAGTFSLADGNRVEGTGTLRTTVRGSCVHGTLEEPVRIDGAAQGDVLQVALTVEPGPEPVTQVEQSMECVIRTLREMPSFLEAIASLADRAFRAERCPIQVPLDQPSAVISCGGLDYHVRRQGGR
jgi:hypothetical protein